MKFSVSEVCMYDFNIMIFCEKQHKDIFMSIDIITIFVSELYLNPKSEEYGENYQSGQIRIAFLPGNSEMSKVMYGGVILGASNSGRSYGMKTIRKTNGWSNEFHRFIIEWSDGMYITVLK